MELNVESLMSNSWFLLTCAFFLALFQTFDTEIPLAQTPIFLGFLSLMILSGLFIFSKENQGIFLMLALLFSSALQQRLALQATT